MNTKRLFRLLGAVALAVVAVLTALDGIAISNVAPDSPESLPGQKSIIADTARWAAMDEYYQKLAESGKFARSRAADAARWEALGRYYQQFGGVSLNPLRSQAAAATRWTAVGEYYQNLAKIEAQNQERARAADAARWTGLGEYYAQSDSLTP